MIVLHILLFFYPQKLFTILTAMTVLSWVTFIFGIVWED